jgi:hypothetical protein
MDICGYISFSILDFDFQELKRKKEIKRMRRYSDINL